MNPQELIQLKQAFPYVDFTPKLEEKFLEIWKEKSFCKNESITEAGRKERYFYFVLSGVQVIYLIDNKGDRVVFGFTYTGDFSGVYSSFIADETLDYFLESLSEIKMLVINQENYLSLFGEFPQFNR